MTVEQMTLDLYLKVIRERAEKATPGPWEQFQSLKGPAIALGKGYLDILAHVYVDAEFIAHSREDIPRLLAALEKCREQRDVFFNANVREHADELDVEWEIENGKKENDAELEAILAGLS